MVAFAKEQVETEVLVVGAGPVGLLVAGELARRGVEVRVV
jgi:2-polyprenyl-6-methoxyphenol hydroxylase-like FAD-dependent oxidoreductase